MKNTIKLLNTIIGYNHCLNFRYLSTFQNSSENVTPMDPKKIDFHSLKFSYIQTKSLYYNNYVMNSGWGKGELRYTPYFRLHAMSNVFHYGQSIFEGLKVFHKKDGRVSAFNPSMNLQRMNEGAKRLGMPTVSFEQFIEAIFLLTKDNIDYVPPYGTQGSFYVRPLLSGHGSQLGLGTAPEYIFAVIGCPVGNYYKAGVKPIDAMVVEYDRAASHGVGSVKCAGNYAADLIPSKTISDLGFQIALYLDPIEHKYIEEFSTSNMIAISKDRKTFITPKSNSILKSNTNIMLQQLAKDRGMNVEVRPIAFDELSSFSEIGACGTAVVISPIRSVTNKNKKTQLNEEFPVLSSLYKEFHDIQIGDLPDRYNWHYDICSK